MEKECLIAGVKKKVVDMTSNEARTKRQLARSEMAGEQCEQGEVTLADREMKTEPSEG